MIDVPLTANAVVVGGGIIGLSTAYHLARAGMEKVVLLERRKLGCGTTWHSVGSVGQVRGSKFLSELSVYTADLFRRLETETGMSTGFRKTGSIMLGLNRERVTEMQRTVAAARLYGLEATMLTTDEVTARIPFVKTDDVLAGMYLPDDGGTNPIDTVNAFAKAARLRGVSVMEDIEVLDFLVEAGSVQGVLTDKGTIECPRVAICAGFWSRELAEKAGARIPLLAAEHFYAVTEPINAFNAGMPMIRVPDERTYYKADAGKLLFGCFEEAAKPWGLNGIPPDFCFDSLPEDLDHFEPVLSQACIRMPLLAQAGIQLFFNGPEAFTPDGEFHIGELPNLRGLYTVSGMNSVGVMTSGGVGRLLSQIITEGSAGKDFALNDVARNQVFQTNMTYLAERTTETVGALYGMQWPGRQFSSARGVRQSPVHQALLQSGACMESIAGWERPAAFAPVSDERELVDSYTNPNWFSWALHECTAILDGCALADSTVSAKFVVPSCTALEDFIATLAPVGSRFVDGTFAAVSEQGTVDFVFSLYTLDHRTILILADAQDQVGLFAYLSRHLSGTSVFDATSSFAIFDVSGRTAEEGMTGHCDNLHLASNASPTETVEIGMAFVHRAWVPKLGQGTERIIVQSEYAASVWKTLRGDHPGIRLVGWRALNMVATLNARAVWRRDFDRTARPEETIPNGKDSGLVALSVEKSATPLWGGEPLLADGVPSGQVTSAAPDPKTGRYTLIARPFYSVSQKNTRFSILAGETELSAELL